MRERAEVRQDGDGWTATLPCFGFSPPERCRFASQHEACTWAHRRLAHHRGDHGAAMADVERSHRSSDGIAAPPLWSPTWCPAVRW